MWPTSQGSVHAPDVDQQTHHGHVDGSRALSQQLVLQDLAALAALGHGIEVDVGKRVAAGAVGLLGEDALVVLEDELEEVELDVLAPQRDAIVLLQMLDLIPTVDGRHAPVGIAAGRRGCCRVVWSRRVVVVGWPRGIWRIAASFALIGDRRVCLRCVGLGVVHLGVCGQDVSQAVSRVGLVGARRQRCGCRSRPVVHDEDAVRGLALGALCTVPLVLCWLRCGMGLALCRLSLRPGLLSLWRDFGI